MKYPLREVLYTLYKPQTERVFFFYNLNDRFGPDKTYSRIL